MGRLGRLLRLPASERNLLLQSFLLLVPIRIGLSLLPFRAVLRLQRRARAADGLRGAPEGALVEGISRAVTRASRVVPGARCLAQALAAQALLRRRGVATELRIGVARGADDRLRAHAWLESEGRVVFDRPHPEVFQPLSRLPEDGR